MHLFYHRENFYHFNNLNIKRILNLIPNLEISDKIMSQIEYHDNRKRIVHSDQTLFLINLYMGNYIKTLISFYANINVNIIPCNLKYPLSFSILSESDNSGLMLHCDTSKVSNIQRRYVGCIVYLNDDYEGGEIVFPLLDLKIKPKPGSLITYRSDIQFPHYVKKITKGNKWLLQGYFRLKNENE